MDFTLDPAKDAVNVEKHGVSLAFGAGLFDDDDHVVFASHRLIDGEERFKVVGAVEDRLWTAVYVVRGGQVRFISVRRSNDGEGRAYRS